MIAFFFLLLTEHMAVVYFVVVWVVGQLFEPIEHTVKESLGPLVELFLTLSLQGQ